MGVQAAFLAFFGQGQVHGQQIVPGFPPDLALPAETQAADPVQAGTARGQRRNVLEQDHLPEGFPVDEHLPQKGLLALLVQGAPAGQAIGRERLA